ncbi:hypothetical protein [Streptomyces mirabilis]
MSTSLTQMSEARRFQQREHLSNLKLNDAGKGDPDLVATTGQGELDI